MNIFSSIKNFGSSEDGAVTVDWVVLTAGIVALGFVVVISVSAGAVDLGDKTTVAIENSTILDHSS